MREPFADAEFWREEATLRDAVAEGFGNDRRMGTHWEHVDRCGNDRDAAGFSTPASLQMLNEVPNS